jgi:cellulose synthase/poly-beta-1,6-N-acetylglucosamine synthase-like glycosyltransferase
MKTEVAFWFAVCGTLYPYTVYPFLLRVLGLFIRRSEEHADLWDLPSVSLIIPVHNEEAKISRKLSNSTSLRYPSERLEIIVVSDGSTDRTVEIVRAFGTRALTLVELPVRRGKAAALNAGLARAAHDVVVFSDVAIELDEEALCSIVQRFKDPHVGCVSGEDRIALSGGESLYGSFELLIRRMESHVNSIVGASGSFYAQRRGLCTPFREGMAPDFLSVLRTVELGYRAVSEPRATGSMTSVKHPKQEFERKVRTLIRGMTTLFAHTRLLNPFRFGFFSFALFSHKVARWVAPIFLAIVLLTSFSLLDSPLYSVAFIGQVAFYLGGLVTLTPWNRFQRSAFGKAWLYFVTVNGAIVVAWFQYARGIRQELWTPSER